MKSNPRNAAVAQPSRSGNESRSMRKGSNAKAQSRKVAKQSRQEIETAFTRMQDLKAWRTLERFRASGHGLSINYSIASNRWAIIISSVQQASPGCYISSAAGVGEHADFAEAVQLAAKEAA